MIAHSSLHLQIQPQAYPLPNQQNISHQANKINNIGMNEMGVITNLLTNSEYVIIRFRINGVPPIG